MGDRRFDPPYARVSGAVDRLRVLKELDDQEIIAALAGATQHGDALLANVLATEAQNRALRASKITSALGEAVLVMDKEWRVRLENPAAVRMLGWAPDELIGKDPHAMIHAFCSTPRTCHLGSSQRMDMPFQDDDAIVMRKDGRTIRVAYTMTPVLRAGVVEGGVLVIRDVDARAGQAEKARAENDRLETILQKLPEGILTMDLSGDFTYANAAAERILGRPSRDILERSCYDPAWSFIRPSGEAVPATELPFKHVLDGGEAAFRVRLGVLRDDGTSLPLSVNTVPLPDPTGKRYAVLVSLEELRASTLRERRRFSPSPRQDSWTDRRREA